MRVGKKNHKFGNQREKREREREREPGTDLLGVVEATRSHVVDVNNAYSTLASGIKFFI